MVADAAGAAIAAMLWRCYRPANACWWGHVSEEQVLFRHVERILASAQPLQNLRNGISPVQCSDAPCRFEFVAETAFAYKCFLASNLGKQASTNLEPIQNSHDYTSCVTNNFALRTMLKFSPQLVWR